MRDQFFLILLAEPNPSTNFQFCFCTLFCTTFSAALFQVFRFPVTKAHARFRNIQAQHQVCVCSLLLSKATGVYLQTEE